jgi:uncharacterized RDD family membrane protein YckC
MSYQEKSLAKLSLAAMFLDLLVCVSVWQSLRVFAGDMVLQSVALTGIVVFLAVCALYVFLSEVLLNGRSIGRLCLGLSVAPCGGGETLSFGQRIRRFLAIVSGFGLRSLNPNRLPSHNCSASIIFRSDLAGVAPTRSKSRQSKVSVAPRETSASSPTSTAARLVVRVVTGPHLGTALRLTDASTFAVDGIFKIGRLTGWGDLVLSRDNKVSQRHCRLSYKAGQVYVADGANSTSPSSNGTFVGGQRIGTEEFVPLQLGNALHLGDSRLVVNAE